MAHDGDPWYISRPAQDALPERVYQFVEDRTLWYLLQHDHSLAETIERSLDTRAVVSAEFARQLADFRADLDHIWHDMHDDFASMSEELIEQVDAMDPAYQALLARWAQVAAPPDDWNAVTLDLETATEAEIDAALGIVASNTDEMLSLSTPLQRAYAMLYTAHELGQARTPSHNQGWGMA